MDSILTSVKKVLGIEETYTHFDEDIIISINSVMMTLNQLGVGPTTGFTVTDSTQTWSEFLAGRTDLTAVKVYVCLKVRLLFDPPSSSHVLAAMERTITEQEWRLGVQSTATEPIV